MKLGFVSAILPELKLEDILQFAVKERFRSVELMCWPEGKAERKFAGVTHVNVTGLTSSQASEISALAAQAEVEISGLGYYPNPLDPNPKVSKHAIDHLKRVIRAASLLRLKQVNTFVGRDWSESVDANWPRFLKVWKPLVAFAEDQGVKIGIENCPMLFTQDEWPGGKNLMTSPVIWRRAFHDIPSASFGLNYDPSHFILQHMDPLSPLREFRSKLFHVHAKDVQLHQKHLNEVGAFDHPKHWHSPRIPGFGDIHWHRFIAELHAVGYTGAVSIEVEDDSFGKTLNGRANALRVARNFLSPFFP